MNNFIIEFQRKNIQMKMVIHIKKKKKSKVLKFCFEHGFIWVMGVAKLLNNLKNKNK